LGSQKTGQIRIGQTNIWTTSFMKYSYIVNNKDLENCIVELKDLAAIAIDLEFDKNRYAYGFNLCLVQIFTGEQCYLIDPLSKELDIQKLFPSLEDKSTQKVVFAFGEDLRLLHSLGCFPKNLFDIATAAKLLNYPPGSLAVLLETIIGVQINKSSQNSNWLKRPLTENQLNYAALDVIHLLKLRTAIVEEATEKNKLNWIDEENAAFDKLSYVGVENNNFIKKKDMNGLTEFEWNLFKELMLLREGFAKATGRPSYQIADKEVLKELAQNPDKSVFWNNTKGNRSAIRFSKFKAGFKKILIDTEALNLSKTDRANKPLPRENAIRHRTERSRTEKMKKMYFKPIQQEIAKEHGEHAATIILGNRIIAAILAGDTDQLKNYQLKLIKSSAQQLGIDLNLIFNSGQTAVNAI